MLEITKDNFDKEVLMHRGPVLVDFWAPRCMPCRMLAPIIEEIAEERPDIKVCKIDVDKEPELAIRYSIFSIPTLMVFNNAEVSNKVIGLHTKEQILGLL
ncbi:MAG: thioredoxin [Firmicutes bacterium]|nr:thioredoxin [Bacillota bacterium]